LLASASIVLGLAFGLALAHVLLPIIATATALNFNLVAPQAHLTPSATSLVIAIVLGFGVTLLAAWLPARRAVRIGIAETIRGRGRQRAPVSRGSRWTLALCLWAGAALAVGLQAFASSVTFGLTATLLIAAAIAATAPPLIPLAARAALPVISRLAGGS